MTSLSCLLPESACALEKPFKEGRPKGQSWTFLQRSVLIVFVLLHVCVVSLHEKGLARSLSLSLQKVQKVRKEGPY